MAKGQTACKECRNPEQMASYLGRGHVDLSKELFLKVEQGKMKKDSFEYGGIEVVKGTPRVR